MSNLSTNTCLLCDLPWKNNRVCYDGKLMLPPYCGMVCFDACAKTLFFVKDRWLIVVDLNTGNTLFTREVQGKLCCPMLYEICQQDADPVPVVCAGDDTGMLYTWNRGNGDPIWKANLSGAIAGTPAHQNGLLHIATRNGIVHVLHSVDGTQSTQLTATQVIDGVLHDGQYYLVFKAE